ncbi:MAG: lysine--tRNA ligase [Chloroflexota bacterium]|nr:lysine--tRNA ligase [Chloroflexota bacterium]
MSKLQTLIAQRRAVRDRLLAEGRAPYPQDGHRTHTNAAALAAPHDTTVTVAGRVRVIREMGKLAFVKIEDESGMIQLLLRRDDTHEFARLKSDIEVGDFMRATGTRFLTKAGEESVQAATFELLAKALRPLPDSYYGLADEEQRYRRRYLDLIMNKDVAAVFRKRSLIISSVRRTLERHSFLEVETPTLQPLYGGANARPFVTNINAYDGMEMYLKISDELYLKRLIVGGLDRVYEIDKDFRNEGLSYRHNPEFTMMECYAAYWDYADIMRLVEEIYKDAAIAATGSDIVPYDMVIGRNEDGTAIIERVELNFRDPWARVTMKDAIKTHLEIDVDALSDAELGAELRQRHPNETSEPFVRGLAIAKLFEATEDRYLQPTFIIDFPRETTALCKPHRDDPTLIERLEPYIARMEVGNGYTELNDPVLQRQFMTDESGAEAHPIDEDFIQALEYGMPPAGGLGLGLDRMVMLLTNQSKIRDVLLFPTMKPRAASDVEADDEAGDA